MVPAMMFLPILTGQQSFDLQSFAATLAVSLVAVVAILIVAWFVAPRVIAATIAARSRDIFILSVIVIVLGIAYLTSRAGLSTGLGAFVAGIVISDSEYSHQVLADVLPFRETFNSLFFVCIGMLLNPPFPRPALLEDGRWERMARSRTGSQGRKIWRNCTFVSPEERRAS